MALFWTLALISVVSGSLKRSVCRDRYDRSLSVIVSLARPSQHYVSEYLTLSYYSPAVLLYT